MFWNLSSSSLLFNSKKFFFLTEVVIEYMIERCRELSLTRS